MKIVETAIVSAEQMRQIESQIFAAGMPVAALMEKAARLCFEQIKSLYPLSEVSYIGILAGPGHNGGDALVIARELYLAGYRVKIYRPFFKLKELTASHANYVASLGLTFDEDIQGLKDCQVLIDGLFGFGLTRDLPANIVSAIETINSWSQPIVSIDLPSGIHTDTGNVMGGANRRYSYSVSGLVEKGVLSRSSLRILGKQYQDRSRSCCAIIFGRSCHSQFPLSVWNES